MVFVGVGPIVGLAIGSGAQSLIASTVILARNGVRWCVPNSEIMRVANESKHKARQVPLRRRTHRTVSDHLGGR